MTNNSCKITHISDTHGYHNSIFLEGGDILIHSGDILDFEKKISTEEIIEWIQKTPYQYKIIVLGNHDEELSKHELPNNIILLQNSTIEIHNIIFYGLTATLEEQNTRYPFGELNDLEIKNQLKDTGCDVLITHGPPKDILDNKMGRSVGSKSLLEYVKNYKPKYHLFGHAHHSKGTFTNDVTTFSNASIVDKLTLRTLGGKPFNFEM